MSDPLAVSDADLRRVCHLISHDLRNPLAAIVTNLEFARRMLDQLDVDPDLSEAVRDSVTACDVLRRIVANFDLLAKGEQLKVTMHDVELEDVAREVVRRCQARAEQVSLRLELEAPGATVMLTDRAMLALATENLIAVSLQHAPPGTAVSVRVTGDDAQGEISVIDVGKPVDPAMREEALGIETHTTRGRRDGMRYGRGLALLCARIAIEAVGGKVAVDAVDESSRMCLIIPRLR